MFGFSFGEIMILLLVGVVVVGPRKLPTLMRTAGQWITKLRRMSTELRSQSGIDEIIRAEGLEKEISELRSLSRVNVIDSFVTPALAATRAPPPPPRPRPAPAPARALPPRSDEPLREREYPLLGCDAYDALPDDAAMYKPEAAASEADPAPDAADPAPGATEVDAAAPAPGVTEVDAAAAPEPAAAEAAIGSDPAPAVESAPLADATADADAKPASADIAPESGVARDEAPPVATPAAESAADRASS